MTFQKDDEKRAKRLFVSASAALLCACQPLYAPDYQGEALAVISGQVTSSLALEDDIDVAISWAKIDGDIESDFTSFPITERADVSGSFPARFEMRIYEPPPDEVEVTDFNRLSLGILTAIRAGADVPGEEDLLGVNEDFLVLYVPDAASLDEIGVNGVGAKEGYNLYLKEGIELPGYDECATARDAQIIEDCDACQCPGGEEGNQCDECARCDNAANLAFACHIHFKQYFMDDTTRVDLELDPEQARESIVWRDLFGRENATESDE